MDFRRRHILTGFWGEAGPPQLGQGWYGGSFCPTLTGVISTFWPVPKHLRSSGHFGSPNRALGGQHREVKQSG